MEKYFILNREPKLILLRFSVFSSTFILYIEPYFLPSIENFIEIKDNSGGISSDIADKDIFKIGNNENDNKSGIGDNKMHFQSKTITIQYEMPIGKVEELKDYYGEDTAKRIGIKTFDKLYL